MTSAAAVLFLVPFLIGWSALRPSPVAAQTPADTVGVTTPVGVPAPAADTLEVERVLRNLPEYPRVVPASFGTGVWEWDREGLLSTRALTLLELLEEIPGIVALRGGDHGQPTSVTAFGLGAGRVRVFLDGVEMPPLDGGVVDLSRVGIGGAGMVRLERSPGELRIELVPLRFTDFRPETLIEVGTGDLNTNHFRGTFAHPFVAGTTLSVSLDRIDTEGPGRAEPGVSYGGHLRHTLFAGENAALAWELRTRTSRRPSSLWNPPQLGRTDLAVHGRFALGPAVVGAFVQRSTLDPEGSPVVTVPPPPVPGPAFRLDEEARTGAGLKVSVSLGGLSTEVEVRKGWGRGLPSSAQSFRAGGEWLPVGGVSASIDRESWEGRAVTNLHGRAWTAPLWGISLFGEIETGKRAVPLPFLPEEPEGDPEPPLPDPTPEIPSETDRSGYRAGAEFRAGGLVLAAAGIWLEADSLHPHSVPMDRAGAVTAGGERMGGELHARLPLGLLLDGLELQGSAQLWDADEEWRYSPRRSYQAGIRFHDIFLQSSNLEVWTDVGVRGRDPMRIPLLTEGPAPTLASVPFQQSWFARLQIRVVSMRIFILWENFTLRQRNQDFPDRILPATRALYGVRWTLWN